MLDAPETAAIPQAVANQPAAPGVPVLAPPADQAETQPTAATQPEPITPREVVIPRKDEDISKMAREQASKKVSTDARKGSVLNPLNAPRKILYALAGKAIRQREIKKFEKQYRENDDVYGNAQTQKDVDEATLARLKIQLEHSDLTEIDKIEEANNEVRQLIVDQVIKPYLDNPTGTPEQIQKQFQDRLTILVKNSPNYSTTAQDQINRLFGKDAVASGKLADAFVVKELVETADWVKQNVDAHKIAIDKIQEYVKFQLANPSWAAASEANLTGVDRWVRRVEENRFFGPLLSPAVVGAVFGIAASTGEVLLTKAPGFLTRRVVPIIAPILGPIVGGVVSALKRNLELKQTRAQLQAESTYNEQTPTPPQTGKTFMGRLSGEYRRADLEKFKYDSANVTRLRTTVDGLLGQDLLVPANRENLIKAIADIEARLNFSNRQHIDLVTFESRGKVAMGRLQLIEAMTLANQEIRSQLKTAGKTDAEIDAEMKRLTDDVKNPELAARYKHFTTDKTQQDREFRNYRWRQSAGAFAFGATVGLVSGIVTQEGLALAARHFHWGEGGGIAGLIFKKGETSIERTFNAARGVFGQDRVDFAGVGSMALGVDTLKGLYEHPTNVAIPSKGIWLAVGADHHASLLDSSNNPIPTPPMEVTKDGHLMVLGSMDKVPTPIKDFLKSAGWNEKLASDPSFNLQEKMAQAYKLGTPGHETFRYGNFNIDLESGANHQMSLSLHPGYPDEVRVHGFLEMDATGHPNLNIDGSFNGNASLTPDQINLINGELAKSGWPVPQIEHVHIPGKDQLVNVNEYLRAKGALQPTARELWHDNQTPMRFINGKWLGADGKELQFYHRITPDGKYIELDFSKMESSFQNGAWRNWDYTADNQYNRVVSDIVRQPDGSRIFNNFEIMITSNEQANSLREAVIFNTSDHTEISKGLFRLPVDSPEARAFFKLDENGKPIFNKFGNFQGASYIEVAHKQANNLRTILSTTQGDGVIQATIPGKDIDYNVYHLNPPQATELIPPGESAPPVWFDVIPTRFQPLPPGVQGEERVPPEKPQKHQAPPVPSAAPDYGYGYGERGRLTDMAQPLAEDNTAHLSMVLNSAYSKFDTPTDDQAVINDLTPPEQINWLQQQVVQQGLAPTAPENLDEVETILIPSTNPTTSIATSEPAIVTTPSADTEPRPEASASPTDLKKSLDNFINSPSSPIPPANKAVAIRESKDYVDDPILMQSQNESGLNRAEAVQLLKEIIVWTAGKNQLDLISPDPALKSYPNYDKIHGIVDRNNLIGVPEDTENNTNKIIRYLQEFDPKYNLTSKGNLDTSLALLLNTISRAEMMCGFTP